MLDEQNQPATSASEGFREGSTGFREQTEWNTEWLPPGFRAGRNGAIEHSIGDNEWEFLCSSLEISAATRNEDGEDWGRLLRVLDRDGNWHEWAMPMAELAGGGEGYRAKLLSMGLELAPGQKARNAFMRLLTAGKPQARARCVTTLGWHDDIFLFPDETIGENNGERLVLQTTEPLQHNFRCLGSLQGWQSGVGRLSVGNSRLVFSIAMAFAAPMLRKLGIEGGGVHLRGASSTGKTTAAEVASSVCGGGPTGYKTTWRTTDNALETVAAIHNDNLLVLDEIGQIDPEPLGQVAYMLANGQAKRRMTRTAGMRKSRDWRLLFLSNGEVSLSDKLRESRRGGRPMAGQEVRVLDIAADAGAGHGIFSALHDFSSGQAFADELKRLAQRDYGYPLHAFLEKLVKEEWLELANKLIKKFVREVVPAGADGQIGRAAYRFAVVAAAGHLAQLWGIVPWPQGEAEKAAKCLFEDWLAARGGLEAAEITEGIATVRHFLERHGVSRFMLWDEPEANVQNRAGFRRYIEGGKGRMDFFIFPEAWKRDILGGQDADLIAREMVKRSLIKVNADGKPSTKQRLPDGTERKVYVVLAAILEK
jgi:putative DNA primase/helicase